MSPLATTGMESAAFTAAIVSYSARPLKPCSRVRPCTVSNAMPADSAAFAITSAFFSLSQRPVRIFSVTGTLRGAQAATTASMMRIASGSLLISAEPAKTLHTFLAGQPMLMSMICAPRSMLYSAASAISRASTPAICTAIGPGSPLWSERREVFSDDHNARWLVTISLTACPAPSCRHSMRNGRSVTPAIGATNRLFGSSNAPSFIGGVGACC